MCPVACNLKRPLLKTQNWYSSVMASQAPEYDWDDFKGQDLSGKILVIMNNDPDWDEDLFAGETRLGMAAGTTNTYQPLARVPLARLSFIRSLRQVIRFRSCKHRGQANSLSYPLEMSLVCKLPPG